MVSADLTETEVRTPSHSSPRYFKPMESEIRVKNTFIDFPSARSLSLEEFMQDRDARSCPASVVMEDLQARHDVVLPILEGGVESVGLTIGSKEGMQEKFEYPALRSASLEEWLHDDGTCLFSALPSHAPSLEEELEQLGNGVAYCIKNTFIEFPSLQSPLSDGFVQVRNTRSCPGSAVMPHLAPQEDADMQAPFDLFEKDQMMRDLRVKPLKDLFLQYLEMRGAEDGRFWLEEDAQWEQSTAASSHAEEPGARSGGSSERSSAEGSAVDTRSTCPVILNLSQGLGIMSTGSVGHDLGQCNPCAFLWKGDGCTKGQRCEFCHLCPSGEVKRRKKEKLERRKAEQKATQIRMF